MKIKSDGVVRRNPPRSCRKGNRETMQCVELLSHHNTNTEPVVKSRTSHKAKEVVDVYEQQQKIEFTESPRNQDSGEEEEEEEEESEFVFNAIDIQKYHDWLDKHSNDGALKSRPKEQGHSSLKQNLPPIWKRRNAKQPAPIATTPALYYSLVDTTTNSWRCETCCNSSCDKCWEKCINIALRTFVRQHDVLEDKRAGLCNDKLVYLLPNTLFTFLAGNEQYRGGDDDVNIEMFSVCDGDCYYLFGVVGTKVENTLYYKYPTPSDFGLRDSICNRTYHNDLFCYETTLT